MSEPYHSQRRQAAAGTPEPKIGGRFWRAFKTYVARIAEENYFTEHLPSECQDGFPIGMSTSKVDTRMLEELGYTVWCKPAAWVPGSDQILDVIEFFFRRVSKPTKSSFHSFCGGSHPEEYDQKQGRYDFTVAVNDMLRRFNHPYKIEKGRAKRRGVQALDRAVSVDVYAIGDTHLAGLLDQAVNDFYDRSRDRRRTALTTLANALERLKTMSGPDKRAGARRLVESLSDEPAMRSHFEQRLKLMTELSNSCTIRHHERGKTELVDDDLVDFLFYDYYNLVRLMLSKHKPRSRGANGQSGR